MHTGLVNIVSAADFHFCDRPPASRLDNYAEALFSKLDQIITLCVKVKAKALLIPGDLFHVKTASKNSHWLVQRLISCFTKLKDNNCQVIAIAGNHDLSYSNLDTLEKQPFGTLVITESMILLTKEHPWGMPEIILREDDFKIRIVGVSCGEDGSEALEGLTFQKKDEDWLICMAHAFASPLRSTFFGVEVLGYKDMLELDPDIFIFGHLHKDQGVKSFGAKHFVNVGAVSRGTIGEDDVGRKPKIALISLNKETVKITPIALKVTPADEVFNLEAKEQADLRNKDLQTFIEMVSKEQTDNSDDIRAELEALSFAQEVKEKAEHYLELAKDSD